MADRLRTCVRRSDTVARQGGDEFAIIQSPLVSREHTEALAKRIVALLSEPYDLGEHQIVIGTSVGVALAPADSMRGEMLLKMAVVALYRAKAAGRGTARFFEAAMDEELQARRVLELHLRRAVVAQEFELHYQPLVDVRSGDITAMEALVRWRHPERGLISPDEFIPLAEETGLIVPIGAWVLRMACFDAATWPASVRIAVNISAAEFSGLGLIQSVRNALDEAGLQPERLELEVTETTLLSDAEKATKILTALREMGVRIALDDFGTGYSSLNHIRSFPFDKIKIDRIFVNEIETSADCQAIVRAVTGIGCHLGIATTAEGVETVSQFEQLRAQGCDQVQGFLFSRPVAATEVPKLLTARQTIFAAENALADG